jgi:polyisoprenoid-binding protein YceI
MKTIQLAAITVAAGFAGSTETLNAQTTLWKVDAAHSQVKFSVTHMIISEVEGSFKKYEANISTEGDAFLNAHVEFTIDVNSISTDNEMRDNHLKGDDFFNTEKFPKIAFKATSLKKFDEKNYELKGTLTIRDITKNVTFKAVYGGTVKDPYGNTRVAFKVTGAINRFDYNLKWNMLIESGGAIVSDTVNFNAAIELIKQK